MDTAMHITRASDLYISFERHHLSVGKKWQYIYCQNNHLVQYIATIYISMQYEELEREKGCRGPDLRALCLLVFDGQTASIFYDSILQYRALRKYLQGQAMNKK